jgi:hypothetical protein
MAPLSSSHVSPHFTRAELNYNAAPLGVRANLERLAAFLETVRATLGVPLRVTSGYRSPDRNAATVGASATSQHMDGTAADFVPVGLSVPDAMSRLLGSGIRAEWGQLIAYPYGSHIHIALPTRGKVGEVLAQVSPDSSRPKYVPYTAAQYVAIENARKTGAITNVAVAVAGAAGVAAVALPRKV